MEGPEIKAVEAVIDNGSFGKRTLRFETGRLAQQADGAVAAYLPADRRRGGEDVRRGQDPGLVLPP